MAKIAITGASGLVGSHLVQYLAQKGHHIKAMVRTWQSAQPFTETWAALGVETVEANVLKKDELIKAFLGVDIVIHTAAIVDPYAPPILIQAVNVKGTACVIEAARFSGVKQLVFVSSLSVITGNKDQFNSDEHSPLLACGEPYADSKIEAERIVCAHMYDSHLGITVVRPGFIYGPRERAWLPQLVDAIAQRRAVLIDGGTKETNVIYIENLNRAIEATLLNADTFGEIYNLTDGQKITKKDLFDTISKELDLPLVHKNLPSKLVRPIFVFISTIAKILPTEIRKKLSRFSMAAYRLIGVNQSFSINKAEEQLGYSNRIPFQQGMAETLRAFKSQKPADKVAAMAK